MDAVELFNSYEFVVLLSLSISLAIMYPFLEKFALKGNDFPGSGAIYEAIYDTNFVRKFFGLSIRIVIRSAVAAFIAIILYQLFVFIFSNIIIPSSVMNRIMGREGMRVEGGVDFVYDFWKIHLTEDEFRDDELLASISEQSAWFKNISIAVFFLISSTIQEIKWFRAFCKNEKEPQQQQLREKNKQVEERINELRRKAQEQSKKITNQDDDPLF